MRSRWGTNYPDATAASIFYNPGLVARCPLPTGNYVISSMQADARFINVDGRNYLKLSSTPKIWNVVKDRIIYAIKDDRNIVSNKLKSTVESRAWSMGIL
ncbi:expressed unknown protein [Seminavis robusta]|uniref:Uncharacterized protein n=1 Tax=Seminavis robusta TaxID=568900 RepID=A0A9N8H989_9STRA|nr:expressed unknown protein [Seminavis robusta]|eukprot:Sro267_g103460.1 n/a (100) ;mRNA; r:54710-55009